ncbi:MAG: TIGR03790 family protein [Hydrogenophilaceae bacterium]|nr:TIGR03790 family protein [Hydrogenophilaceae bacterium]
MRHQTTLSCLFLLAVLCWHPIAASAQESDISEAVVVSFDQPGLTANQLGVIVNDEDPDSVAIARYYVSKRKIPKSNMIHVRFKPGRSTMTYQEFARIKREVDLASTDEIQAYALTWTQPYRVDCMSITSAFAFGFDPAYCASGCKPTRPSPYFNSNSSQPYTTHKIRPAMSLAAGSVNQAIRLIDRGIAADGKNPNGTAYLVSTRDSARNVRAKGYENTRDMLRKLIPAEIVKADSIQNKRDVMFYFTGLTHVPHLETNTYLPGAIADHLTSAGGALLENGQMSILKWIDAGATGSYGAVIEPCNFPEKFPVPALAMAHYLQGETLIESYWKSVQMPGQGIFVGEPLARPFIGHQQKFKNNALSINMRAIEPGTYSVQLSPSMIGPYREVGRIQIGWGVREIRLDKIQPGYYRFENLARKFQEQ